MNNAENLIKYELNLSQDTKSILQKSPLSLLNIPEKVKKQLLKLGIVDCLVAIETIKSNFSSLTGITKKMEKECLVFIDELLIKLKNSDLTLIEDIIDTRESFFSDTKGDILVAFPYIISLFFEKKKKKDRDKNILIKRFNLDNQGLYTLDGIGTYYDLTRERVRQIEAKSIAEIDSLLSGTLKTKTWKIDKVLIENYLKLKHQLSLSNSIIKTSDINLILNNLFTESISDSYFSLLMKLMDYEKIPNKISGFRGILTNCWYQSNNYSRVEIEKIYKSLDIVFNHVLPINKFDLFISAIKESKKKVSKNSLEMALKTINEIKVDDELISVKFEFLRNVADKTYRILSLINKPTHSIDIAKEINRLEQTCNTATIVRRTNVTNQCVSDKRFRPLGKSGKWGLSEWDYFKDITIVEVMEEILHKSGQALSFEEIITEAQKTRPNASIKSFKAYLSGLSEKFVRVDKNLYALSAWNVQVYKVNKKSPTLDSHIFYNASKEVLSEKNPMPFPLFIEKMMAKINVSRATIRQRVTNSKYLKTKDSSGRHKLIYCDNLTFNIDFLSSKKKNLKDKIHEEILLILKKNTNIAIQKGELYKLVNINVPCIKTTFYQYLSKLTVIKQYEENGIYYVVYITKLEGDNKASINSIPFEDTQQLINNSFSTKIDKLIKIGETKTIEFKESLSLNIKAYNHAPQHANKKDKKIETSALKTIVGFLNSDGGNLIVGVADNGDIPGLEPEFKLFHKNNDHFLLHFKNLLSERIGDEFMSFFDYHLVQIQKICTVLLVACNKSTTPCFLDDKVFYIRTNPATVALDGQKRQQYINHHFK